MAIAIVLLLALMASPIALLIMVFPVLIAEIVTGERSMFVPNGGSSSKKSLLFQAIAALGFLVEALIIAAIFYGIYGLIWGWPHAATATHTPYIALSQAQIAKIQIINIVLLVVISYFTIMFSYHAITKKDRFASLEGFPFFINQILPFIAFVFGFIYLIGTYFYLQNYPQNRLGLIFKVSGFLYLSYLIYTIGRTVYFLSFALRSGSSGMRLPFWLRMSASFAYYGLFIYFAYQIYIA